MKNPVQWSNPKWRTNPKAQILLSNHPDIKRFGVASIDEHNNIVKIEEKPKELNSDYRNLAISGCYLFTPQYFEFFEHLTPSARGEYEITDIIRMYLENNNLSFSTIDGVWSDVGTHESIAYVNNYLYSKSQNQADIVK